MNRRAVHGDYSDWYAASARVGIASIPEAALSGGINDLTGNSGREAIDIAEVAFFTLASGSVWTAELLLVRQPLVKGGSVPVFLIENRLLIRGESFRRAEYTGKHFRKFSGTQTSLYLWLPGRE
jgi:hypothetical protein